MVKTFKSNLAFIAEDNDNGKKFEKSTLKSILNRLMLENHLSVSELSKIVNLPASTISRMKCEENINPTLSSLVPIANYFDIKLEQLIGDEPLPQERNKGEFNPKKINTIQIPIITANSLLSVETISKNSFNKSLPHISVSSNINEKSFSMVLQDSSLSPILSSGTVLVFDPDQKIRDGDIVIVSFDNKIPVFRKILCDGEDYYFDPINKEFGELIISKNFKIYGVMVIAIIETRKDLIIEKNHD